ncbi:MAG: ArnT family glycosyltransferase [Devosia sp.]
MDASTILAPARAPRARRDILLLQVAVAYFVLLKLIYGIFVPPNGDEAYYWLWGGHLQLSYFDHSPMVGWMSAIVRPLGWTPASLHLPAFLTFLVLAYGLRRAAYRLAPEDPQRYFWLALAVFCASPLLNTLTTLNYPDHALIGFSALALLQFGTFLDAVPQHRERPMNLYVGAMFLGLAGLSKYSAVLIPAGLVAVLIAVPAFRRLFRSPHLYLAGALTVAIMLPVLIWNAQNAFATLEWHASGRLDGGDTFEPLALVQQLVLTTLLFSPFLIVPFVRFVFDGPREHVGYVALARGTAIVTLLVLLPLAAWGGLSGQFSPHWLVLAFLPFILLAPLYLKSRLMVGLHLVWGAALMTVATLYYVLTPLATDALGLRDDEASRAYGQEQLAAAVTSAMEEHDATLVAVTGYPILSRLAFALGSDEALTDLGRRYDRLTGRTFGPADTGRTAIMIGRPDQYERHFDSIEVLETVETWRFGQKLEEYTLLLGRGFRP